MAYELLEKRTNLQMDMRNLDDIEGMEFKVNRKRISIERLDLDCGRHRRSREAG